MLKHIFLSGSTARLRVDDPLYVMAANIGWSVEMIQEAKVSVVGLPKTMSKGIKPTWKVILTRLSMQLKQRFNFSGKKHIRGTMFDLWLKNRI